MSRCSLTAFLLSSGMGLKPKNQCIGFDRKRAHDCDAVHEVCRRKDLDEPLTRFALGYAVCNVDKGETAEEMIDEFVWIVEKCIVRKLLLSAKTQ